MKMLYKIKKFNISVHFNFPGEYTGNESIYDTELKKMFLFNYQTKQENISASCLSVKEDIKLENYVEANLKSFSKISGTVVSTKKHDNKFFVLMELPYDKVIQIYFIRKQKLYCFSATISLSAEVSNLLTFNTLKKMLHIISSIKDIK